MKTFNMVHYLASASGLRTALSLGDDTGRDFTCVRKLNCLYNGFLFYSLLSELKQFNAATALSGGEKYVFLVNGVCLLNT